MSFVYIIITAYLIGVNIAGLVMLFIQKKEKNLSFCERGFSDTNDSIDTQRETVLKQISQNEPVKECEVKADNTQTAAIPAVTVETATTETDPMQNGIKCDVKLQIPIDEPVKTRKQKRLEAREKRKKAKLNKSLKDKTKKPISNFTIILIAVLGGALFIYAGMFFMKYKLKNLFFMITIPTIIGFNIFVFIKLYGALMVWGVVSAIPK